MEVGDAVAPLHEGTTRDDPGDLAVGHHEPLRLAEARAEQRHRARATATRSGPTRPARRWTSTRSSTRSTRRRARVCATSSAGRAPSTTARGVEAGESIEYFAPVPGEHLAADPGAGARPAGARAVRAGRRRHGVGDRLPPRRPHRPREQHELGDARDRRRERRAPARARAAAGHPAQGQHHLREPAHTLDDLDMLVDESKPATKELAPFFRALRPLVHDARPTIADLRDLIRSPGPNNDLIELTAQAAAARGAHRERVPARDPDPRPLRPRDLVRAALHPGPVGMAHRVRPGGGVLRRERALRARPAGVRSHGARPRRVHAERHLPLGSPELLRPRTAAPTARAAPRSPRPTARLPGSSNGCEPTATPNSEDPPGP